MNSLILSFTACLLMAGLGTREAYGQYYYEYSSNSDRADAVIDFLNNNTNFVNNVINNLEDLVDDYYSSNSHRADAVIDFLNNNTNFVNNVINDLEYLVDDYYSSNSHPYYDNYAE